MRFERITSLRLRVILYMLKILIKKDQLIQLATQMSNRKIAKLLNVSYNVVRRRMKEWGIKNTSIHVYTIEERKRMSEIRKSWCAANPDKHPWKKANKHISAPCEYLKEKLKENGIDFVYEIEPLFEKGYYYSVDIAFPDRKLAIEVNGNQHYDKEGKLKPYYQQRHNILRSYGWEIMEVRSKKVYDPVLLEIIKQKINGIPVDVPFNYQTWSPKIKKPKISDIEPNWRHRTRPKSHKVPHPTKEELQKIIWEKPVSLLSQELGVSDKAIEMWCKRYGINKPPRGYWNKRKAGMTHEQALVRPDGFEPPSSG